MKAPVPLPVHVNLETSLACNLRCEMCAPYRTGLTKRRDRMSPELLERVRQQLLGGAAYVALTVAGEPFADPTWRQYIALAEATHTRLVIACNGTLLPEGDDLLRLLRHTEVLEVSVDAAEPELFAQIRGRDVLEVILANLRRVARARATLPHRHRPKLGITAVLMRQNIHQLPVLVDLAADLGLDSVGATHLTVFTDDLDAQSLRHHPTVSDTMCAAARRRAQARGIELRLPPPMSGAPPPAPRWSERADALKRGLPRLGMGLLRRTARVAAQRVAVRSWEAHNGGQVGCNYLQHRVYVSVGGDVTPCCMPGRPVCGNILQQDFVDIWNGPVYTRLREGLQPGGTPHPACAHCSVNRQVGRYQPQDAQTVRPTS